MNRLTIGRRIAIAFAATVVLLVSIDTTMACRFLWRSHCVYRPAVYYCPPAYKVVTHSTCSAPAPSPHVHADPLPSPPPTPSDQGEPMDVAPPDPVQDAPQDSFDGFVPEDTADDSPLDDTFELPPNDLEPPPADDGLDLPPEDDFAPPADDSAELPEADEGIDDLFNEDATTTDEGGLPDMPADDMPEDEPDVFDVPLPDDDGEGSDLPLDDSDDSLDDLFSDTTEPADAEPRVADNVEEDEGSTDDFLDDLEGFDDNTDANLDDADDLFPEDEADDLFPEDAGDSPDGSDLDQELQDLFGQSPTRDNDATTTANVKTPQPTERIWVDNTGRYNTVAKLVKIGETHVRLLKSNGRYTTVPKYRLSEVDLKYVEEMSKHMGIELLDQVVQR